MKRLRLLVIVIFLVCAVGFLSDFFISGGHPSPQLGAAIGCFIAGGALIAASVREK